jgi:signal transduction histidine kinase
VKDISALAESLSVPADIVPRQTDPLAKELTTLAELARAASAAAICAIGWQGQQGAPALVRTPARAARFDALGNAGFALLASQLQFGEPGAARVFHVRGPELAARLRWKAPVDLELVAAAASGESGSTIAILTVTPDQPAAEIESILELLAHAALAAIAAQARVASRDFWLQRAQALEAELAALKHRAEDAAAERRQSEVCLAEAARLKPRDVPAGIARLLAGAGPFDAWIVALAEGRALRVEGCSPPWDRDEPKFRLDEQSALFDSFSRQSPVIRLGAAPAGAAYREDRVFARSGFSAYLCLPFAGGVIALAAHEAIAAATAARTEALAARLGPILDAATFRCEAQAQRALAQRLALKLYGAVDSERARIARDLHDDQAQLIATAQVALEAPRAKARRLLAELEETLRVRMRELRPATLGAGSLRAALRGELQRLAAAGLKPKLVQLTGVRGLSRPLQNVCWQIVREAVSNIIRHARARRVELSLERAGGRLRLSITDDGRGLPKRASGRERRTGAIAETGLAGLAERVALLGGVLKVESRPGRTRVAGEIPTM